MIYRNFFKRVFDVILSGTALVILSPVMLLIAILVKAKLGSPVIFTQNRPGKNEKIFKLYKFRTMTDERDENGNLLPDEVRLNKFGRALRATSLDELPEVFNILLGSMSWVGPRPLLVKYLPFYKEGERIRHSVRPGLTGLAQVSGRNNLGWDNRLMMDVEYVNNISFAGDLKIIIKTILKVLKHEDVVSAGCFSMNDLDIERGSNGN